MKFSLIRADDQVHLEVETFNLEPQRAGSGYELRPVTAGQPGHIAITFPVQQVMEYVGTDPAPVPKQIGPIFAAGTTRVVFHVPVGHPPIPFTVAGILGALPGLALVTDGSAGTVAEPKGAPAVLQASTADLVLDAMGASPNGALAGAPVGAPVGAPGGASRGAAGHNGPSNGTPGEALVAELQARALARRSAWAEPEPELEEGSGAERQAVPQAVAFAAAPSEEPPAFSGPPTSPGPGPQFPSETDTPGTPRAPAPPAAPPGSPGTTALGFPSKLSLGVAGGATRMAHAAHPVANGGNVELWHSRLSQRTASGRLLELPTSVAAYRVLKTTETTDGALSDGAIKSVLSTPVQNSIALQTTVAPKIPATARRLWLSPLGAWLDVRGEWPNRPVQGWRHRMVMGRDHYVQVVQQGRLYPLGHKAVLVSTMERTDPNRNGSLAPLFRRDKIHVTQPSQDFGVGPPADPEGRLWPWHTVELLTLDSPAGVKKDVFPLAGPASANLPKTSYLEVGGLPFRFDCQAFDRGHRVSTFDLPLLFVPDNFFNLAGLAGWFAGAEALALGFRGVDLDGQVVALAPSGGGTPPDTTTVVAHSAPLTVAAGGPLGYRPTLPSVQGVVPALSRFTPAGGAPRQVTLAETYLKHGFDATNNPGEALFAFAGPAIDTGSGNTGGIVAPSFNISGLSRKVGLVGGDLKDVAGGTFDVQKALAGTLDAIKLFGIFKLTDLLPSLLNLGGNAPRMVSQTLDGLSTQELKWSVPLFKPDSDYKLEHSSPLGVARLKQITGAPLEDTDGKAALLIEVKAQPPPGTTRVQTSTLCQLVNLQLELELAGDVIVTLPLPLFEFKSVDGGKPDVNVRMGPITFGGVLAFVQTLASLIDYEGLSDPPAIEQIPGGVRSSFYAPIPGAAVGMFSLENITFGAALSLYFGSPLELALSFSTKENPFICTVAALGGGGWLEVVLSTDGLRRLQGALQFGAALSVNLGVARGSVSVMGGIEFWLDGSDARLTGYLQVRGEVQVLGLISVCIESTLALTYDSGDGKLKGSCEWVLRVKVVFIRKTVRVHFSKTFAGSNGDPTFAELMAPAGTVGVLPWDRYCGAFAED
jgi:hypothetical protein